MILVTGATGLVGSHLLYKLLSQGKHVKAIHRSTSDLTVVKKVFSYYISPQQATDLFNRIIWVEADVLNVPQLTLAFEGVETVYHCAAMISYSRSDFERMRKVNIEGTANMINLALSNDVVAFCHVSSIAALGKTLGDQPITEETEWNQEQNNSDYAITKYGAEMEVWRGSQEGLNIVIVNPGVIIGPGFWESGSGVLFKKVNEGMRFYFPMTTGFVGINDVVYAMTCLMDKKSYGERFTIVSENLSFDRVLKQIATELGKTPPRYKLKPWLIAIGWFFQRVGRLLFGTTQQLTRAHIKNLFLDDVYDNNKINREIGIEYKPIQEVIAVTADYFKKE
ncbi:NAD-dependent epimerase/dehydratase family protein [Gangjinia marincola]|uniref:NAD-dependent epimerase/dehydratase family protein n=1 Tax=Gangjinia marincola TaxID=578463 RepID=A0ABN1MH41_9FLAO